MTKTLDKSIPIKIGGTCILNWHGYEEILMRVLYVYGDTVVLLEETGKPINVDRRFIAHYTDPLMADKKGFYLLASQFPETVENDQIILVGYFNGVYWLVSGCDSPVIQSEFSNRYHVLEPYTTQNIMRVFDKMLVMLPVQDAGDCAEGRDLS